MDGEDSGGNILYHIMMYTASSHFLVWLLGCPGLRAGLLSVSIFSHDFLGQLSLSQIQEVKYLYLVHLNNLTGKERFVFLANSVSNLVDQTVE